MSLEVTCFLLLLVALLVVTQLSCAHWLFDYLDRHDATRYSETLRLKEATVFCVHELRAATNPPTQPKDAP